MEKAQSEYQFRIRVISLVEAWEIWRNTTSTRLMLSSRLTGWMISDMGHRERAGNCSEIRQALSVKIKLDVLADRSQAPLHWEPDFPGCDHAEESKSAVQENVLDFFPGCYYKWTRNYTFDEPIPMQELS